jgi:hypothetical protein
MICLDCLLESKVERRAVSMCTTCGVAVCPAHVVMQRAAVSNAPHSVHADGSAKLARKLVCSTCWETVFESEADRLVAEAESIGRSRTWWRGHVMGGRS